MSAITLLVDDPGWRKTRGLNAKLRAAAEAALRAAGFAGKSQLTLLLSSDEKLKELNRDFRGLNKPTNVLSFPASENADFSKGRTAGRKTASRPKGRSALFLADAPVYRGDIAIAYGVTAKEAEAAGKRFADHASHLVVHGVLHLAGYDHETDRDAKVMEPLEVRILKRLGIADPYGAPARKSAKRSGAVTHAAARQLRPAVRPKDKAAIA